MLELYRNIKRRREELGITQAQLAELIGYADKTMISKIENGSIDLAQSKIVSIAEALRTTPAALMGWDSDPTIVPADGQSDVYYLNPETAKTAQKIFEDPNYRMLFDAASDARPEDLQMAAEMLRRFKEARNE